MLRDDCIFCRIAAGEIPSETVYEDEYFKAILDLAPAAKGHTLILPKAHYQDVTELEEPHASRVLPLAAKIGQAMKKGLGCDGFNLLQNNGEAAGQTVFHFHMHVIPRVADETEALLVWEPGSASKEEMAETGSRIREGFAE
ncbi:MAG: HIT family protein [Lachnospiraceae bacterium]|nr:HIT family protein [Lachnospiraceae bacterium]